jgi:hypothetical protein
MSDRWYNYGSPKFLLLRSGMPNENVQVGLGDPYDDAVEDLSDTPIQSAGRDPLKTALSWCVGAGIIDLDTCEDFAGDDPTVEDWANQYRLPEEPS